MDIQHKLPQDPHETTASNKKIWILFELFLFVLLIGSELLGIKLVVKFLWITFTIWNPQTTPPVLCLLALIFLHFRDDLKHINFSAQYPLEGYMILGILFACVLFLVQQITGIVADWIDLKSDYSTFIEAARQPSGFFVWGFLIFPLFAFSEELFFRAYLIQSLERVFGKTPAGTALSIIISSVAFGFSHLVWGPGAIFTSTVSGFIFAFIYCRFNRGIWVPTVVHCFVNEIHLFLV